MQAQTPEVSTEKANTPAEQVLRPANGKARRYLVKQSDLHQLGGLAAGGDCVCLVPLGDHDYLLNKLIAEQRSTRALAATLRSSFPLFDDEGLDQERHHCEWSMQQDRKRLHAIIGGIEDGPSGWSNQKPTQPGAYWIRGNLLQADALVQVQVVDGVLWCNLHQVNTELRLDYGFTIEQLHQDFEWLGPLAPMGGR